MAFYKRPLNQDQRILEAIRTGKDEEVLSVLYKEVLPKVKRYILKNNGTMEEVKDIFQDAVIVFYRYVKAGKFNQEYEVDGFLFGVSKNLYLKHFNKTKKEAKVELSQDLMEHDTNELQNIITRERHQMIRELMDQVGERCKELLTLSVFDKRSMKEIAELMGFSSEDAAKTGNYKCKQRLMKLVKLNPSLMELFKN